MTACDTHVGALFGVTVPVWFGISILLGWLGRLLWLAWVLWHISSLWSGAALPLAPHAPARPRLPKPACMPVARLPVCKAPCAILYSPRPVAS